MARDEHNRRRVRRRRKGERGEREREEGESREGERYIRCRVGVDVAAVEGDRAAADIDAPTLPNKEGARVLVSCWKALP